ncbi:MAG TPA: YihY/virulence factor BrkB family protein [Micromonosporaceae bacterium]|nr:YihY/virulence factor BrkB family protein [Micromonosporaceae bacterium]
MAAPAGLPAGRAVNPATPFHAIHRWYERTIAWARRRSRRFDHFWRARERYNEVLGGRLAAAIAYYAFFAAFALALVAYSILGYALSSNSDLKGSVSDYLTANLPWLEVSSIEYPRGRFAVIGFVGLILTGLGWVEGMRSSQRLIWKLDEQPGNLVIRRLVDLGMLAGLGILLAISLWVTSGVRSLLFWFTPEYLTPLMQDALNWAGVALGWLVNLLLAAALLAGVPRLRMPPRRLLPPALIVATGLTVLATIGSFIFTRTKENPAYALASSFVGLLLFFYLFSQLILFGAALAATSRYGRVMDLAAGPPPAAPAPEPAPEPAGGASGEA